MKKLIILAIFLATSTAAASGKQWGTGATFSYEDAALAATTEKILATNVSSNIASADVDLSKLTGIYHMNLWLSGGAWPIDVAYNSTSGLPIELFVRYRATGGAWAYDGYVFPGLGTAFYRVPLPPADELEVVVYNPRAVSTGDVRAWGSIAEGSAPAQFVPQQISSVIPPAGSAVVSRAYASYCFRRGPNVSQVRYYLFSTDSTATELMSTGFYRPSYNEDGAYWGPLSASATTPHRWSIAGDLICMTATFGGTFNDAATAAMRFSVAVGPYAP